MEPIVNAPTLDRPRTVDVAELEQQVKEMYRRVATDPHGEFHFEMGRALAERLGYPAAILDHIPAAAIESFAGVGYHFDLAALKQGEAVLDLGSGAGMDTFTAALEVGIGGRVAGVDMTDAQRAKAEDLRDHHGFTGVTYHKAYIEHTPFAAASFDCVISNGVINLAADKAVVFHEAARVLKPGGRLAISDIVSDKPLPEGVTCNATLWAACIGGALPTDRYLAALADAGLEVTMRRDNPQYRFLTPQARKACAAYGVRSVSLLAVKNAARRSA